MGWTRGLSAPWSPTRSEKRPAGKPPRAPIARIFLDVLGRLGGDYTRLALRLRPDHEKPTPSGYAPRSFQGLEPKRVDERATQQPLCLVHFSDLHFDASRPWNEEAPIYQLPGAVRSLLDRIALHPDLIVITGDIAVQGRAEEFEQASQWIEERLLPALEPFERGDVIVVPGNHDMDQKGGSPAKRPWTAPCRTDHAAPRLVGLELTGVLPLVSPSKASGTSRGPTARPHYLDGGIVVELLVQGRPSTPLLLVARRGRATRRGGFPPTRPRPVEFGLYIDPLCGPDHCPDAPPPRATRPTRIQSVSGSYEGFRVPASPSRPCPLLKEPTGPTAKRSGSSSRWGRSVSRTASSQVACFR